MYSRRRPAAEKSLSPDKRMKERKFRFSLDEPDSFNEAANSKPNAVDDSNVRNVKRGSVQLMEPVFFDDTKFVELLEGPPDMALNARQESKSSISTLPSTAGATPSASKEKSESELCLYFYVMIR